MAITTTAGDGVRITTAAMNETLGSQTQQTGSNTVVVSNTFTALNNGNVSGSIGYVNRLCIIRQGTGTEETRLITVDTAGTGTTRILTVHENWTSVPASSDTIHVSYVVQDAATVTGLSLITKRVQDYTSTRKFRVGNAAGTPFAYFALLFGASLESVDNSSTSDPDVRVESAGRFDSGYLAGGVPVGGGEMYWTPAVNGELAFEGISGCELNWYDMVNVAVARPAFNILVSTTSKLRMKKVVNKFTINDFRMGAQDSDINDVYFSSDDTGTTPRVQVRDISTGNELKNILFNRFNGLETVTSGQDPVIKNFRMTNMSKIATIATGETWTFVNGIHATISTASQADVSIAGTGELLEKFSFSNFSHDLSDTPLTAKHYVVAETYRGSSSTLTNEDTADANGLSVQQVEVRRYVDSGGTALTLTTSSNFAEFSSEYGYIPIIKNITPANENESVFPTEYGKSIDYAHSTDDFQSETTAATARTLGDTTHTVSIENQTNSASILKYTAGTGTLSVGNTVTGGTSSATGVVVEIIEGDSTAGSVMLDTRSSGNYTAGGESLSNGAGWSATMTASSETRYKWLIDADTLSMQQLYDYLNAKLDESTLDTASPTFFNTILFWAIDGTNALPVVGNTLGSPNIFNTVRETTKTAGWAVYNTDLGGVAFYTADNGSTFTPQSTVNLTITAVNTANNPLQSVQVAIYKSSDNTELMNTQTNASGLATTSFTYTADTNVYIRLRKSTTASTRYYPVETTGTIKATGLSVTVTMRVDTIVAA